MPLEILELRRVNEVDKYIVVKGIAIDGRKESEIICKRQTKMISSENILMHSQQNRLSIPCATELTRIYNNFLKFPAEETVNRLKKDLRIRTGCFVTWKITSPHAIVAVLFDQRQPVLVTKRF